MTTTALAVPLVVADLLIEGVLGGHCVRVRLRSR